MAIIEFSSLVNRIKGRVSSGVVSYWKGKGVIKSYSSSIHNDRSAAQQEVRSNLSELSGEFYSLTDKQKELWKTYASALSDPMTALNAYVAVNSRLQKYFPDTARKTGPPSSPSTPKSFKSLSITAYAAGLFCVHFTKPTNSTLFAIVDAWAMPGLDKVTNPSWSFLASAGCDTGAVQNTPGYPADTVVKFRARTMDAWGRVSPWSETISLVTQA
jgi:hypothetical protein